MHVRPYEQIEPFVDARRLADPRVGGQSGDARLQPEPRRGDDPRRRRDDRALPPRSEELYLVSAGSGRLLIDGEEQLIGAGDCALIPPGARHKLFNVGSEPLRVICACAPAYSDEDTCLTE